MRTSYLLGISFFYSIMLLGCKKSPGDSASITSTVPGDSTLPIGPPPSDPEIAASIGFFLDDWKPKSFAVPAFTDTSIPVATSVTVEVDAGTVITKVPRSLMGNNANIWMGQVVTEPSLMNYLTLLHPGIIRFPGGSLSDLYFWNASPDQAPSDAPLTLSDQYGNEIAANYWYGKNKESWTLSVDNYYHLLQQTASEGMITVNYGYARYGTGTDPVAQAAHLAADWVRYDKGRTRYWEVGNEDNGTWEAGYRINPDHNKDNQEEILSGQLYGAHFIIFADSMRAAAAENGKAIYIGAQLLEKQPAEWQTVTDKTWNAGVLAKVDHSADFYILHSYFTDYQTNAGAEEILHTAVINAETMMNYVKKSLESAGVVAKPVALTEWNITSQGSMQQVSFINGMHATIVLGEALASQYGMTARWDLANGWSGGNDMGLFNIGDEPGVLKWNPRPAFYYLYFFQKMLGDRMVKSTVSGSPDVLSFASSFTSGETGVVLVNIGKTSKGVAILSLGLTGKRYYWFTLTGGNDNGSFSRKVFVNGKGPGGLSGGPASYSTLRAFSASTGEGIKLALPAMSVVYLVIDKK